MRKRLGLADPGSQMSEPFRTLRLALQIRSDDRSGNVVLVTSAEPKAGKSTVAANYALVSSIGETRVLLIDGDLHAPVLHDLFDVPREPGIVEALASGLESGLDRFTSQVAGLGHLHLLTAGRPIPRSSDLASSDRMGELLRVASAQYDLVVIDSPPLLTVADAEGLASHDGVQVVLVAKRNTQARLLTKALRRLELIEANVAGTILNQSRARHAYP